MISHDAFEEEIHITQEKMDPKPVADKKNKEMDIVGFEDLPKLFVSSIEKLMHEFDGSVKDFIDLFKVPKENIPVGNLHQQNCNTAKKQFDSTNGQCNLFGLNSTTDEQIVNWIS